MIMEEEPKEAAPVSVEIRPEVTMLSVLKHLNYKAWFAMAEFIDNSIQSFAANRTKLKELNGSNFKLIINISIDTSGPGRITITDNAAGISEHDFPRAFRAAHVPTDRTGLSEFGIGMKSAACWFAENWSVRTKALGETVERTISFDIREIVEKQIENLITEEREEKTKKHYTVVTLRGLHHIPLGRTVGKIKAHLASIYRVFLRQGELILTVNKEQLEYNSPKILKALPFSGSGIPVQDQNAKAVEWRKDINLDFGNGQRVSGFAALREIGSTPFAGFALFRRNRLIEGSYDETYRPSFIFKQTNSYPYQRLFGELHLEGFDVSHTKDGFRWEQYEDIFLEYLKGELEAPPLNLLAQAESYRATPSRKSIQALAVTATKSVAQYIEEQVAPFIIESRLNPSEPPVLPEHLEPNPLEASEKTVEVDDGRNLWIITIKTSIDPACEDWLAVAKHEQENDKLERIRRLSLDISLAHPFSTQFLGPHNENVELFLRIATAICVGLVLSEDMTGISPEIFLFNFNYLMRGALVRTSKI